MDEVVKYLKALIALQVQAMTGEADSVKPEVLLARAGLSSGEIAAILGKKPNAVAMTLSRAK
jgi:DNA-directed RNA polymerase specialized sigma24 family protein